MPPFLEYQQARDCFSQQSIEKGRQVTSKSKSSQAISPCLVSWHTCLWSPEPLCKESDYPEATTL